MTERHLPKFDLAVFLAQLVQSCTVPDIPEGWRAQEISDRLSRQLAEAVSSTGQNVILHKLMLTMEECRAIGEHIQTLHAHIEKLVDLSQFSAEERQQIGRIMRDLKLSADYALFAKDVAKHAVATIQAQLKENRHG